MAFTDKSWNGDASKYSDTAAYCDASLINENTGPREGWVEAKCHLPIKEPDGTYNKNAIRNAMARIGKVQASAASKKAALSKLMALRKQSGIGEENQQSSS